MREPGFYPPGIKPGDFVQMTRHFGDIFFEVTGVSPPSDGSDYWGIDFITYDKYGSQPRTDWENIAGGVRQFYPAEMAIPVMMWKRQRYKASFGQYDPFYGFAPVGTPLRTRDS